MQNVCGIGDARNVKVRRVAPKRNCHKGVVPGPERSLSIVRLWTSSGPPGANGSWKIFYLEHRWRKGSESQLGLDCC